MDGGHLNDDTHTKMRERERKKIASKSKGDKTKKQSSASMWDTKWRRKSKFNSIYQKN